MLLVARMACVHHVDCVVASYPFRSLPLKRWAARARCATTTWRWPLIMAGWVTLRPATLFVGCCIAAIGDVTAMLSCEVVNVSVPEGKVGDFAKVGLDQRS